MDSDKVEKTGLDIDDGGFFGEDDDIVTLRTTDGDEIDFITIAGIVYENNFYAIMQPVELLENMEANEALVFRVIRSSRGDRFDIELNDEIINAVFAEYYKLLAESEKDQNNKK